MTGAGLLSGAYALGVVLGAAIQDEAALIPLAGPVLAVNPHECHQEWYENYDSGREDSRRVCTGPIPLTNALLISAAAAQATGAGLLVVGLSRPRASRAARPHPASATVTPLLLGTAGLGVAVGGRF
jgi:hypothetical protein